MKNLFSLLFVLCSIASFAQSSDATLTTQANVIKNETVAGANTATRVGQMFVDIILSKVNNSNLTWANILSKPTTLSGFGITDGVPSTRTVNGHALSADVTVTAADVGLENVDNTSDDDKPVSIATQEAIETVSKVLITGATTLDDTAFGKEHIASGTSADYTITLLTAVGNEGKMLLIKGDPLTANLNKTITIDPAGTELIDNRTTAAISTGGYITLIARVTAGVGSWDVINFEQGAWISFTPVFPTGFSSSSPTYVAKYKLSGKTLSWYQTATAHGVGTGTVITQTVPGGFTAANETRQANATVTNNNAAVTTPGMITSHVGTTTLDLYPNSQNGSSWTASQNRSLSGTFMIEVQ